VRKVIYPIPNSFEGGLNETTSSSKKKNPPKNARIKDALLNDKTVFCQVSPEVVIKIKPIRKPNRCSSIDITGIGLDKKENIKT